MKNQHRIFVALEAPLRFKHRLLESAKEITKGVKGPIRWLREDDLHITLVPPWYSDDNDVAETAKILQKLSFENLKLKANRIVLGPNERNPRLIWTEIEPDSKLAELKARLHEMLRIRIEDREFKPHITLAWLDEGNIHEAKRVNPQKDLNYVFEGLAVLLMESGLKGSHRYEVLQRKVLQ